MNRLYSPATRRRSVLAALTYSAVCAVCGQAADSMYKPQHAAPGGLDPRVFVTGIAQTQQTAIVRWEGPYGPFQIQRSATAVPLDWQNVGEPTGGQWQTLTADGEMGLLRVQGRTTPRYEGAEMCSVCHATRHGEWMDTAHAGALKTLEEIKQDKNSYCLPCHTVGYGQPSGFVDAASTPGLAGVQCENCHGPGGDHVANLGNPAYDPTATLAAAICGGCHTDAHHPTYDEWQESMHSRVDPEVASSMLAQGEARMQACGACHSGAVRMSMLEHWKATQSNPNAVLKLPTREDAAYFGVTCGVCHNAHEDTLASQLRNPTYSTNNFSYSTSSSTSFAAQYNPDVQMCGQCHNMRGARWQDTSRPPHHSPQYNLLVGQGGYDLGQPKIGSHGLRIAKQCTECHTHSHEVSNPDEENPNYTGHTFEPTLSGCVECHASEELAAGLIKVEQQRTKALIAEVKGLLDQWGLTKSAPALQAKYGALAWEYTNEGQLSNPTGDPKVSGPSSAEQSEIPDAIKQARMNLYLVEHDASYGVHNGTYTRWLLSVAKNNVNAELAKP